MRWVSLTPPVPPLIRIVVATVSIAIPFALVAIPLNLHVRDASLRQAGALLLTVIVVIALRKGRVVPAFW